VAICRVSVVVVGALLLMVLPASAQWICSSVSGWNISGPTLADAEIAAMRFCQSRAISKCIFSCHLNGEPEASIILISVKSSNSAHL